MTRPTTERLVALSLVAALASAGASARALAQPAAASGGTAPAGGAPAASAPAAPAPSGATTAAAAAANRQAEAGLDRRIADLHARLGITAAEEPAWSTFTGAMRENMEAMNGKLAARKTGFGSMNAVDDLRSYADVVETQAAGIQRLVGPFGTLYAGLSPEQRTKADQIFRSYTDRTIRNGVGHPRG